jgi:carbamoylphosphate synthase large subunit
MWKPSLRENCPRLASHGGWADSAKSAVALSESGVLDKYGVGVIAQIKAIKVAENRLLFKSDERDQD